MFEIFSSMIIVDDGMTRDDDQAIDRQLLIVEKPRQTVMTTITGVKAIVDS